MESARTMYECEKNAIADTDPLGWEAGASLWSDEFAL